MLLHLMVLAASLLSACAVGRLTLPSSPDWRGGCAIGIGLDATLHGSASDARLTWAIDRSTGIRLDLLWPHGYSARFLPSLEVLDASGRVVGREGDRIIGACVRNDADGGALRVDGADVRPATWTPGDG